MTGPQRIEKFLLAKRQVLPPLGRSKNAAPRPLSVGDRAP